MFAYLIRRLVAAFALLFVVSAVTFVIFFEIPKIAGESADQLAAQYVGRDPSPEAIQAVKVNLGFDQPLYVQYGRFMKGLFFGRTYTDGQNVTHCGVPCFGYSFKTHLPVWPDLVSRMGVTVSVAAGAAVLWVVGGVLVGVVSALRRGKLIDRVSMGIALAAVSLPVFFTGQLLQYLFRYKWQIWPSLHYVPINQNPLEWASNLVLPWVTLAFAYAALYARLTRAGMLETMSEDYIRTGRAKGLSERRVVFKHGLRAALTPILTIFGLDLGLLLGGAIITEQVFSLQGIGKYAVDAVHDNDLPKILAVTLVAAFFVIIANLVVDVLYAAIDPRVHYT